MTTNRTTGPWEARTGKAAHACIYVQGTDHDVAIGMRPDDAAHIVRCVNVHDELVAALKECITEDPGAACYNTGRKTRRLQAISDIARAALARAKGE